MKSTLLIVTPQASFGALVREGLDKTRFEVFDSSDFTQAVRYVQQNDCLAVLLDAELEDVELSVIDIGFALRQVRPDIQFVLIVAAGQEVDTASLSPVATLSKPISLPDLERLLDRLSEPASQRQPMDSQMPEFNPADRPVETPARLTWLTDVTRAAQQLTQLNLESSAQAAFITRNHELWAYAGQLSREAAQELTASIQRYWDAKGESDLLRFVRLQATDAQHMLYVRKLSDNMNLALVFDAETPFSTIRSQAGKLVKNLFDDSQRQAPGTASAALPGSADDDIDGEYPNIPPISELLGEVPPPIPSPSKPLTSLPWEGPGEQNQTRRASDPSQSEPTRRASRETSSPVQRQLHKRPIPAMDETLSARAPVPVDHSRAETVKGRVPDDLQVTRKQEGRFDPQSVIETRAQAVSESGTEPAHRILIEPPSLYQVNLSYACLLVPRFEHHHLVGDAAARLNDWVPSICVAYAWRLEYISVRPEYLQWIVRVPLATAAGKVIYTVRKHTSEYFFKEFPRFKLENPSGEFWAPGFIVQGGSQPHSQKQVRDFIHQTRIRQGLR